MQNRRELLKLFGAGTLIAPVIGAKADETAAVQLIETPKIKPVELFPRIPEPIRIERGSKITILIENPDGKRYSVAARADYSTGAIQPEDSEVMVEFGYNASPRVTGAYIKATRTA
jgi:hypothetical protein